MPDRPNKIISILIASFAILIKAFPAPVFAMAIIGALIGLFVVARFSPTFHETAISLAPPSISEYPLPHQTPKYPDDVSLRFAMVHDVIHERFPHHGKEYYLERNRLTRARLDSMKPPTSPEGKGAGDYFSLLDDLGAGLAYLGDNDAAGNVMRDKLNRQKALGMAGKQLYTTYANLGTFVLLGNFRKAVEGDAASKKLLRESLTLIRQTIEINPEAHFGREIWQAVLIEFLLAAIDNPRLLLHFDFIGNRLDEPVRIGSAMGGHPSAGLPMNHEIFAPQDQTEKTAAAIRKHILGVGSDGEWAKAVKSSQKELVPFDEPTLGIVGMWRLGAGALPQFALALGEIMMRAGQHSIAWCAYERAASLAAGYWPDPKIQDAFVEHCRARQAAITEKYSPEEKSQLLRRFKDELAHGKDYQQAYQRYEAEHIARGASVEDEHFYDAFYAKHGSIASPAGNADKFIVSERKIASLYWPVSLLFAGLFAFLTACISRRKMKE